METTAVLFSLRDEGYASFTAKLIPNIDPACIIGVRAPALRSLAAGMSESDRLRFLADLPHRFHEENMLHSYLICLMKEPEDILARLDAFLPHVDNWAVCDSLRPKALKREPQLLLTGVNSYLASDHEYTVRFGISMLMCYFLDELFDESYPAMVARIRSEGYYVNMMIAWYFATALAKQWDAVIPYLENHLLSPWLHRKTIQKALESRCISPDGKEYLRGLRQARR